MDKPKNVVLILDGKNNKAHVERGSVITPHYPSQDFAISGYSIQFAMNGGYVIEVSYEGTAKKDFLAFATKDALLATLANLLK